MDATDSLRTDDAGLLADVYRDQAAGLTRWITTFTRDPAAAEDLVHEAFLRLGRELAAGRRPDQPAAWLAQVARHLAISRARRAATAFRYAPRLARPATADDPAAAAIEAERGAAVHQALRVLRADERIAVTLAAEGVGGPEIAERLGRTPLATRALLFRARRRLRPVLLKADAV